MRQLRYAFLDIMKSKRICIIFVLQMMIIFLLISISLIDIIDLNKGLDKLKGLRQSDVYVLFDSTSDEKFSELYENSEDKVRDLRELYQTILDLEIEGQYTEYAYTDIISVDGMQIEQITANENFFDIFKLETYEGELFDRDDYSLASNEVIPIVVGYGLKDTYEIGKTYDMYDCGNGWDMKCKVIGVLKRNSCFYKISNITEEINLNYSYIKPLMINNLTSMSFSDLDMAINSTIYFTGNVSELNKIINKSAELDLFMLSIEKAEESIDEFADLVRDKINYNIIISVIILFFCATGMIANLSSMISKKMREFAIHILCGGVYKHIVYRLGLQILIQILAAIIPAVLILGVRVEVAYAFVFGILICLAIIAAPIYKLYSISISQMVRREE